MEVHARGGACTADQFLSGLKSCDTPLVQVSEAELERLVQRLDLNADGCIAFDEFAAGLLDWEMVGFPVASGIRGLLASSKPASGHQSGRTAGGNII